MHLNEDYIDQWESIIDSVSKTDVPLECIKKIILKLEGGKQQTINIHTLVKQGLSIEEIDRAVNRRFEELDPIIRDVEFVVDIKSVANMIQPVTNKILGKL